MERVLLQDRAASVLGFLSSSITTGSPNETSDLGAVDVTRSPHERSASDAAAMAAVAAAAMAVAECGSGRIGGGTPATADGSGSVGGGVKPRVRSRRGTEDGGGDTPDRLAVPPDVRKVRFKLLFSSREGEEGRFSVSICSR